MFVIVTECVHFFWWGPTPTSTLECRQRPLWHTLSLYLSRFSMSLSNSCSEICQFIIGRCCLCRCLKNIMVGEDPWPWLMLLMPLGHFLPPAFQNEFLTFLIVASARPFAWGLCGDVSSCVMPLQPHKSLNSCGLINPWHHLRKMSSWVGNPGRPPYVIPRGSAGLKKKSLNSWQNGEPIHVCWAIARQTALCALMYIISCTDDELKIRAGIRHPRSWKTLVRRTSVSKLMPLPQEAMQPGKRWSTGSASKEMKREAKQQTIS